MQKQNPTDDDLQSNVVHTTENALLALEQLERNLINGRFKEGIKSYEAMTTALVGQRIWSSHKNNDRINRNFKKISSTARNIQNILQPYVECLEKISTFDSVTQLNGVNQPEEEVLLSNELHKNMTDEEIVRDALLNSPKNQISYTKLKTMLSWDSQRLDRVIGRMKQKGNTITVTLINSRKVVFMP